MLEARRGLDTSKERKADILRLVDVLQTEGAGQETTAGDISATWRLLWTTEKVTGRLHVVAVAAQLFELVVWSQETLFILKNAGLFRTAAGDSFQVRSQLPEIPAAVCTAAVCMLISGSAGHRLAQWQTQQRH